MQSSKEKVNNMVDVLSELKTNRCCVTSVVDRWWTGVRRHFDRRTGQETGMPWLFSHFLSFDSSHHCTTPAIISPSVLFFFSQYQPVQFDLIIWCMIQQHEAEFQRVSWMNSFWCRHSLLEAKELACLKFFMFCHLSLQFSFLRVCTDTCLVVSTHIFLPNWSSLVFAFQATIANLVFDLPHIWTAFCCHPASKPQKGVAFCFSKTCWCATMPFNRNLKS